MASTYSGPPPETLSAALAGLVSKGLGPDSVIEQGGELLQLKIIADRLPRDASDHPEERSNAYAEATTEVLREAADRLWMHPKYRRVVMALLPLDDDLRDKSLLERRTLAGQRMKEKSAIKASSIRTYHQPRALALLATELANMEAERRGEMPTENFAEKR